MKRKVKIEKITVYRQVDENPDLSYLGEYSNEPAKVYIDRQERNEQERNEYRYFNLGCGEADYIEQDYERMEAYDNQQWYMMGIFAEAEVSYDIGNGSRRIEWLKSGGLWGIESDSDEAYIKEIEQEQLSDLKQHLEAFGVNTANFDKIKVEYKTK